MYKKLYENAEYSLFLKTIVELKRTVKTCIDVADTKYGVDLRELVSFTPDSYNGIRMRDSTDFCMTSAFKRITSRFNESIESHYQFSSLPVFIKELSVSREANGFLEKTPMHAEYTSVTEVMQLPSVYKPADMGLGAKGTSYYGKEAAEFYEVVTTYLFSRLLLTDIRAYLASAHSKCEKVGMEDYKANRSLESVRKRSMELLASLLPNGNSRWSEEYNPLLPKGKTGWGGSANKVILMPNGYKALPIAARAHSGVYSNHGGAIAFMASSEEAKKLKDIFGSDLQINVADNKRGLISSIEEKMEDVEAAAEDVDIYKTKVIYYRNFQKVYKFVGDSTYNRLHMFRGGNDATILGKISERTSSGYRLSSRNYNFPNLYAVHEGGLPNVLVDDEAGNSKVYQEGASVIPGIYLKATLGNNAKADNLYSSSDVGFSASRTENEEWDIDTTKPAIVNLNKEAMFKERHCTTRTQLPALDTTSVPTEETRYVAVWKSDTGHKEVVSGTSPKRALSNIRRRIRKDIVDNLNIF